MAHHVMLLTAEEVTDLELIVTVLQPFQQPTTMLSSVKSPSISLVQPVICALTRCTQNIFVGRTQPLAFRL